MLTGKTIILRAPKQEDLVNFIVWRNDIEIKKQSLMHPFPVTKELETDWFNKLSTDKNNKMVFFSIVDKENHIIGYTQLTNINWINRNCYFGIIIGNKEYRGKGVGFEVLELMIKYAFETLNLHKIILEVADFNKTAIKLYEKYGFVLEGILNEQVFYDNKYYNFRIYSIFNHVK